MRAENQNDQASPLAVAPVTEPGQVATRWQARLWVRNCLWEAPAQSFRKTKVDYATRAGLAEAGAGGVWGL